MSLATALLTPILGDASPWTPRRLFQLGEAGGVYDPSDLTAEKVAWRRNLLTWSEDFTNAAWTKANATITANAFSAPDGTLTADKIVENTANAQHVVATQSTAFVAGVPFTTSIFARADERNVLGIVFPFNAFSAFRYASFNLLTGATITVDATVTARIENAGGGWFRCIATSTPTTSVSDQVAYKLQINGTAQDEAYLGNGTSGLFLWGAQLERSSTATAYQRITDFTSDFLAAFPTHGLYQDAAGTTPVTALGQPVGLVIDSKTGGLANVGPELVSGGVIGLLGTATAATYSTTTGVGACTRVDISNQSYVEWSGLNNARLYRLRVQVTGSVAMWVRSGDVSAINPFTAAANATTQLIIAPSGGKITLTTQTGTATFTVLAFNEVPGVHAIQPTNSSRPLLDGRVNLLTFSEQYSDASWAKTGGAITANTTVAPDGTTTGDTFTAAAGTSVVTVIPSSVTVATTAYLQFVHARAGTYRYLWLGDRGDSVIRSATFDLQTGTILGSFNVTSATMTSVGNGYYRCEILYTRATAGPASHVVALGEATPAVDRPSRTWAGTESVVLWGSDFRLAADAAYPYQRVAAATDYADVGVPRSFAFDGFDDSLYTASNMDLSGTDKVTVLAGVRKLSDAAAGMLAETSADVSANNGTFYLLWPRSGSLNSVQSASKGTVASVANSGNTYAAPATRVLAVLTDISGDALSNRINGVVDGTSATDQGTGNFGSYVLFIGRRNNASLPFSGKAYQLIVRGALTDDATLAQAERYVGAKTGLYL